MSRMVHRHYRAADGLHDVRAQRDGDVLTVRIDDGDETSFDARLVQRLAAGERFAGATNADRLGMGGLLPDSWSA